MLHEPVVRDHEEPSTNGIPISAAVAAPATPPSAFLGSLPLSFSVGALLLGTLVYLAGPWAILGNTRLLNLLIAGGIIKYHDRHAGVIEGVADHVYYLKAQDPVAWTIIYLVIGLYLLISGLKVAQFHILARAYGIMGSLGQHARAYFYGLIYKETLPFRIGDAAATSALAAEGAPLDRGRATVFALNAFFLFEIAVFVLFGLLNIGWAAWLFQLACALAIITTLYLWTKPARAERNAQEPPTVANALLSHCRVLAQHPMRLVGLCCLSLAAFALRDAAAYFTAMAFSTQNVLLNVDPSLMLMGVLGGYIASLIRLTPGGIGQFEWGFTTALFIGGVGLAEAATVALLVNFFRYVALGIQFLVTTLWYSAQTNFRAVIELMRTPAWQRAGGAVTAVDGSLVAPAVPAQWMPTPVVLWTRGLIVVWIVLAIFLLDGLTLLLGDLWLLQSLNLVSVFWTNFQMEALLFVVGLVGFGAAIAIPALTYPLAASARRIMYLVASLAGVLAGVLLAGRYQEFLPFVSHAPFGETDPVFGLDISFYMFVLPALWIIWWAAMALALASLASNVICALLAARKQSASGEMGDAGANDIWMVRPGALVALAGLGVVLAVGVWLSRYELLFKENYDASVFNGAAFIDVTGLFSTLGQINLTALVILAVTALLLLMLRVLRTTSAQGTRTLAWQPAMRRYGLACVALIAGDFIFSAGVAVRNMVSVAPNQPVIQLEYIRRHIEATRKAYGIDKVEEVELAPKPIDAPLPSVEQVLNNPALRNAPLWPTFVSYLEQLVDPQHAQRIVQTGGEKMIYGPTLEIFRQEQQLRTYYDFLSLAPLRFNIDGEPKVFATAVRELPILEPQPWLAWWGQRFMLFTHGHGLVMAPVAEINRQGGPRFVSADIPVQTAHPELTVQNQQIYYGAGAASMAVSNVRDMEEFDYPTTQGRAENTLPADLPAGVPVDSFLKRLAFGWRSGEFAQILFSRLITPETRLHYYRQPLDRLQRIAPFLYFDNNPYPAIVDGDIVWLTNAIATSENYPYSKREFLGDKSISRTAETVETRRINYAEDAVKATINATTGQVHFYQIADSPVIETWAMVYPSLFTDGAEMPAGVRQQLTYPMHLFHIQFDDVYIYYHMNDPMYFFNMEDMWDDADEVLGPLLDQGKAITFSIEPYHTVMETGGLLPESDAGSQFVLAMAFTPEGARNLRAVLIAYQDGDDYGRLVVLQAPKGAYIMGPEQADAVIDQDPGISQQISWWNRRGTEVIRGHTTLLPIGDEILYVEPIFIRSQQNSNTQLKRVVVVFRGEAYMAETLEGAVRLALGDQEQPIVQASQ
jgi:uncharacterized membrane protein (UPF0182 family)